MHKWAQHNCSSLLACLGDRSARHARESWVGDAAVLGDAAFVACSALVGWGTVADADAWAVLEAVRP